jgi:O-antigen chain-terminating methyltransferase
MSGEDHAAPADPPLEDGQQESLHRTWMRALALLTPWGINRRLTDVESALAARLDGDERRLGAAEVRLDAVESAVRAVQEAMESAVRALQEEVGAAIRGVQNEVSALRDDRLTPAEHRIDEVERAAHDLSAETTRLRDGVVPAAVARADALLDRLAEELEEVGSLVERSLQGEPLPVPIAGDATEHRISEGLAEVQPLLLEAFRGDEGEIRHRLDHYLPDLRERGPVLDLGCGRGELLVMLREAGVQAAGIEGDPALAAAARRRGLDVVEGDVLDVLRAQKDGSRGAVTAIHLLEHLPPATLAAVIKEVLRVLRGGGLFVAECPNPHVLRVGAALYWQDPTHQRPLLPETLKLFLQAAGFAVDRTETRHPFPSDQLLMDDAGGTGAAAGSDLAILAERVDRLRRRLDDMLNGPRDYALWAVKPDNQP